MIESAYCVYAENAVGIGYFPITSFSLSCAQMQEPVPEAEYGKHFWHLSLKVAQDGIITRNFYIS
mgnify:CR=1 FL=1